MKKQSSFLSILIQCVLLSTALSFTVFSLIENTLDIKAQLHWSTAILANKQAQLFEQHYWQIAFDCWIPVFCFITTCYVIYLIYQNQDNGRKK